MISLIIRMYLGSGIGGTFYLRLSRKYFYGSGGDYMSLSFHLACLSRMLGNLNFIITCKCYFTSTLDSTLYVDWLLFYLFSIPVLAGAITIILIDSNFGTSYFDTLGGGGDPVMFQQMFNVFSMMSYMYRTKKLGITNILFGDGISNAFYHCFRPYSLGISYVYSRYGSY
ncbi:unnamed protein product [Protopolystoma xenopodis]|uniref:Cytochrome c oxidase subunit 1 n=1 Tax=Protopolystoma xenopodis TaxID=117903 RepID=A0A3S5B1D3_9PLAT|nr:unnamed protein product [Protopolystoma xenopodis]